MECENAIIIDDKNNSKDFMDILIEDLKKGPVKLEYRKDDIIKSMVLVGSEFKETEIKRSNIYCNTYNLGIVNRIIFNYFTSITSKPYTVQNNDINKCDYVLNIIRGDNCTFAILTDPDRRKILLATEISGFLEGFSC